MVRSHLDIFQESTSRYHSATLFRLPHLSEGRVESWTTITYRQFRLDVENYARHWTRALRADGVLPGSVVGLW